MSETRTVTDPPTTTLVSWLDSAIGLADLHATEDVTVKAHMLRLVRDRLAALPTSTEGLDAAWSEAEAALPDHDDADYRLILWSLRPGYQAEYGLRYETADTPAAALRALTRRLASLSPSPTEENRNG